ncbi:MAG: GAF domain-containing sensor histidine kinase [Haloplanus sp.]
MSSSKGSDEGIGSSNDALRQMYRITSDHERSFEEKLGELLELGRSHLDVQSGFLTEISDGEQLIVEARGDHELLQAGESCPLSKAYCRKTLDRANALTVQHAAVEGWEDDTAYEEFGLESYIGAKVVVDGEIYGTFCFADSEPRAEPFTSEEETFVELMAEWVSYELFQKRATERIRHQRDQLEQFASVIAHDLRSPLNVAQGHVELARVEQESDDLATAATALDRSLALIEDLLTLARGGDRVSDVEAVDLAETVDDCWRTVQTAEATLVTDTTRTVSADKSRLQQLLENLIRNAVEHGGPNVTVTVGDLDDGFYIADDGPGIPEDLRERAFDDGYSTGSDGAGLGLLIVTEIADAHDWDVSVTESDDGGTRFEITGVDRA